MALGMKRKWKKCEHHNQDYSGQPEAAHVRKIHEVMQNRWNLDSAVTVRGGSLSLRIHLTGLTCPSG
jgi:hypothetical protein